MRVALLLALPSPSRGFVATWRAYGMDPPTARMDDPGVCTDPDDYLMYEAPLLDAPPRAGAGGVCGVCAVADYDDGRGGARARARGVGRLDSSLRPGAPDGELPERRRVCLSARSSILGTL